MRFKFRLVKQG